VYQQLGDTCPDISSTALDTFVRCWQCLQDCLRQGWLQSGHDRSDGGLLTTVLEMAFAGNVGVQLRLQEDWLDLPSWAAQAGVTTTTKQLALAFSEEAGFVLEVLPEHVGLVLDAFSAEQVPVQVCGAVTDDKMVNVVYNSTAQNEVTTLINAPMTELRDVWESTSAALELRQCDVYCVRQQTEGLKHRGTPPAQLTFTPTTTVTTTTDAVERPLAARHRVAILRQEGTNGDREMAAAFHSVGFEAWDVNMHDLLSGQMDLQRFRGLAVCGGFSYADVNGSAKGWAAVIRFNSRLLEQFAAFRRRTDTFSLGVCNGCQLMALLGWVPFEDGCLPQPTPEDAGTGTEKAVGPAASAHNTAEEIGPKEQACFVHNSSGRFESRWCTVRVMPSPAMLLRGMEGSTLG
jgi:phosphoribosylformylglycinamidine synthase